MLKKKYYTGLQIHEAIDGVVGDYKKAIEIYRRLAKMETDDVQPVKHGKWETEVRTIRGLKIPFFACSVCGRNADDEYPYCPNCGARMERSEE